MGKAYLAGMVREETFGRYPSVTALNKSSLVSNCWKGHFEVDNKYKTIKINQKPLSRTDVGSGGTSFRRRRRAMGMEQNRCVSKKEV